MTDLITVTQAAKLLGVSYYTVTNKYIKRGLLPAELVNTGQGKGHTRYQIKRADVEALKERRESGEAAFRPGPTGENKGKTLMYLPRPAAWGEWIKTALEPEERVAALEAAARAKEK